LPEEKLHVVPMTTETNKVAMALQRKTEYIQHSVLFRSRYALQLFFIAKGFS